MALLKHVFRSQCEQKFYDITLAFAGIYQACRLVQQLAHEGKIDDNTAEMILIAA